MARLASQFGGKTPPGQYRVLIIGFTRIDRMGTALPDVVAITYIALIEYNEINTYSERLFEYLRSAVGFGPNTGNEAEPTKVPRRPRRYRYGRT